MKRIFIILFSLFVLNQNSFAEEFEQITGEPKLKDIKECPEFEVIKILKFTNNNKDHFDFNDDGISDLVVIDTRSEMCGSAGCSIQLSIAEAHNKYKTITLFHSGSGAIKIINEKKNGFYKLIVPHNRDFAGQEYWRYITWFWSVNKYISNSDSWCKSKKQY